MLFQLLSFYVSFHRKRIVDKALSHLEAAELTMPELQRMLIIVSSYDGFSVQGQPQEQNGISPYEE